MKQSQTKEELIQENKQLKEKIEKLEMKYAWGLQPIDYALSLYNDTNELESLDEEDYYSEEAMSDNELLQKIHESMKNENVEIFGWHETIQNMSFGNDLTKLLITMAKRELT